MKSEGREVEYRFGAGRGGGMRRTEGKFDGGEKLGGRMGFLYFG